MFDAMDADKDGAVSMDELETFVAQGRQGNASASATASSSASSPSSASSAQTCDPRDTNKDGIVSLQELVAAASISGKLSCGTLR